MNSFSVYVLPNKLRVDNKNEDLVIVYSHGGVRFPPRNLLLFANMVFTYIIDEQKYQTIKCRGTEYGYNSKLEVKFADLFDTSNIIFVNWNFGKKIDSSLILSVPSLYNSDLKYTTLNLDKDADNELYLLALTN